MPKINYWFLLCVITLLVSAYMFRYDKIADRGMMISLWDRWGQQVCYKFKTAPGIACSQEEAKKLLGLDKSEEDEFPPAPKSAQDSDLPTIDEFIAKVEKDEAKRKRRELGYMMIIPFLLLSPPVIGFVAHYKKRNGWKYGAVAFFWAMLLTGVITNPRFHLEQAIMFIPLAFISWLILRSKKPKAIS